MIISTIPQGSLASAPPESAISAATDWVNSLLFGPFATAIGIIAIASIGLALMLGRVEIKRSIWAVFGCFLIFGARGIAIGLISYTTHTETQNMSAQGTNQPTFTLNAYNYDPYAGAAIETVSRK